MKKTLKILAYILGPLLLMVLLLFIFHDALFSYALKRTISNKSEGKVTLKLEEVDLNISEGSISIIKPEFLFDTVYVDETRSIAINRILFEKIEVDRFDIRKLITDGDIIADRFIVNRPQFWITEEETDTQSNFHPEKFVSFLTNNPEAFSGIKVHISDIEISYGSITINEMVKPEMDPGNVDFTILLSDFNTNPDSGDNRIRYLYATELSFKLKDLRRLLKSGYMLEIDSATFSTRKKDLVAGGISLQPLELSTEENSIGLFAGTVVLNDLELEEVRGMEDLSLRSVVMEDGHFTNYISSNYIPQSDTVEQSGLEILAKILFEFELDTISLSNFSYFNILDVADTMLASEELHFLATDIKFDTSAFSDMISNIDFREVAFQTGPVSTKMIPGVDLSYGSLSFSTEDENLLINEIRLLGDSTVSDKNLDLELSAFTIQGISLKGLQKNQTQSVTVIATDPAVSLDLDHPLVKGSGGGAQANFSDRFILEKVRIENGKLDILKDKGFAVLLNGLDIEVDDLLLKEPDSGNIQFENLFMSYDDLSLNIDSNKHQIQTGQFIFDDNQLSVGRVKGSTWLGSPETKNDFSIQTLRLSDFDLISLLQNGDANIGQITLATPLITGGIKLQDNQGNTDEPATVGLIPGNLEIGGVFLLDGAVGGIVSIDTNDIDIAFDYQLRLGRFSAKKGDTIIHVLKQLLWDFEMQKLRLEAMNHKVKMDSLVSNSFSSQFSLKNLTINSSPGTSVSNEIIQFRKVDIPIIEASGLDYALLLNKDSIDLDLLRIDKPVVDVLLARTPSIKNPEPIKNFDLGKYVLLNYNKLDITSFNLFLEKPGDSSHSEIKVKDLTFQHDINRDRDLNFANNIIFSFDEFLFEDTVKNSYIAIQEGVLRPEIGEFRISNIRGSNLTATPEQKTKFGIAGTEFKTSGILFSDINLTNSLPAQLLVGRLEIDDFNLDITKDDDLDQKMVFKLNLEILRRFSKTLTGVDVDAVSIRNIGFHYLSFSDSTSRSVQIDSVGILVTGVKVDTSMIGQSEPSLVRNLTVDLKGRTTITHDSLYEISTGFLHYDFPKRQIIIDSFNVSPRFPDEEFFNRAVYQTDRAIIQGRKVEINDFRMEELIKNDHLHFGSINLVDFNFDLCRDKQFPFAPGIHKEMPREQLMSLTQKFTVDSLLIDSAILHYKEIEEKTGQPGSIYFDNVNGEVHNLTNNLEEDDRSTRIFLNLHGNIMGQAKMDISIYFPLYPDSVNFWLSGQSEKMEMTSLNSLTENLLGLGILNGRGSVDIPLIVATDSIARGNMTFRYKKLKIARYDRKKEHLNTGFMSPFINFLINDLVVKSNNPKFARKPRIGQVYFKRDTRKGVVNYAWKGLLSGMLSTLGFNTKEQRLEKKELKKNQ